MITERLILSVMGLHAGEGIERIFERKIRDILICGKTLWLVRSPFVKPERAQAFLNDSSSVLFLAPASSNGSRPTTDSCCAKEMSSDGKRWEKLPDGISPVTGRLPAYALVLTELSICKASWLIDLWMFSDPGDVPVRFKLGMSTALAKTKDVSLDSRRMKSRFRQVLARGVIKDPYVVFVR